MNKRFIVFLILIIVVLVLLYFYYSSTIKNYNQGVSVTTSTQRQSANTIYVKVVNPKVGSYLTDLRGLSLYTFDQDEIGKSNCLSQCVATWPPYTTPNINQIFPQGIGLITRDDGSKQYTWNGKPLYYYIGDHTSGDTNGDGIKGLWHLAK